MVGRRACGALATVPVKDQNYNTQKIVHKRQQSGFLITDKTSQLVFGEGATEMGHRFQKLSWVYQNTDSCISIREGEEGMQYRYIDRDLELLGYCLAVGHSSTFCASGTQVGRGELDKPLVAAEENFFLPRQAPFSSTGPPDDVMWLCTTINPRNELVAALSRTLDSLFSLVMPLS